MTWTPVVIEGEGLAEPLVPTLTVIEGRPSMVLALGRYSATLTLPDHLAGKTEAELQAFFDDVVPEMAKNLYDMRRKDQRKTRKKARKAT